jgi:hypothetical protein
MVRAIGGIQWQRLTGVPGVNEFDNEHGHRRAASGVSRRTLIGAAGALGIAATGLGALPAQAATHATRLPEFLGSNQDVFKDIKYGEKISGVRYPGVPGLRGVRIYGVQPDGPKKMTDRIAKAWPKPPVPNAGPILYSIYPVPEHVFNGDLNDALKRLIASAPPGSYLTAWHEALSLPYPSYITSESMYKLHAHMNAITQKTHVTYGSIFGGGDLGKLFKSVPPNLGFYGLDLYGNDGIDKGLARLDQFIALAKPKDTKTPGYPRLVIPECNTPVEAERPAWFEGVCERMHAYGSHSIGVLTFWNPTGPLSGPWEPKDKKTIAAMNDIIDKIF